MKKYLRYKNFLPLDYIEKKKLKESKENKKGYQALILLNLILLSFNLKPLFKEEIKTNNNYEINDSYIKPEEVSKWLGLYDNKIVELHVENNEADITYNIDEDISYLEERGIVIKKITNKDDLKVVKKFKLYMHDNKESVIILLTFLQVLLFLFCSTIKEEKDIKEMPVVMTKVNLLYSDVFNELKTIKNINILEMEERAEKWNIKIEISGNEENIVEVLDKLEFFDIKSLKIIVKF